MQAIFSIAVAILALAGPGTDSSSTKTPVS